ncbi:MAG: tryptophan synthase subunit beta [Candidatus Bipolaricaulia bacterium]
MVTERRASPESDAPQRLSAWPQDGHFGRFGGRFAPEILMPALGQLEEAFEDAQASDRFQSELRRYLADFAGRPTPLYHAERLSEHAGGARVYLKREDLLHGGAHKLNNALGQALLAKHMGKSRLIAETGAGQHGVATAMIGAALGMTVDVFMGRTDMERQRPNVYRMELMGANVRPVDGGTGTLKDAINEAMRDWATNVREAHYIIGSVVGPYPFPWIVREFQRVIGDEIKGQMLRQERRLPDLVVACVGGGSNALGTFYPFVDDDDVQLLGVEAGGSDEGHAAPLAYGRVGVLHGAKSYVMQDEWGQIQATHSVSAGLDYPSVGPEHAFYRDSGRVHYVAADDADAMAGFRQLSELEGMLPALEPAHAVPVVVDKAKQLGRDGLVVLTMSGRGDKDLDTVRQYDDAHP